MICSAHMLQMFRKQQGQSDWPNLSKQIVNCGHYLPARPARDHHTVKPDAHGDKPLDAAITRLQHDP